MDTDFLKFWPYLFIVALLLLVIICNYTILLLYINLCLGAASVRKCLLEPLIPVFLIILGIISAFKTTLFFFHRNNREYFNEKAHNRRYLIISRLLDVTIIVWCITSKVQLYNLNNFSHKNMIIFFIQIQFLFFVHHPDLHSEDLIQNDPAVVLHMLWLLCT